MLGSLAVTPHHSSNTTTHQHSCSVELLSICTSRVPHLSCLPFLHARANTYVVAWNTFLLFMMIAPIPVWSQPASNKKNKTQNNEKFHKKQAKQTRKLPITFQSSTRGKKKPVGSNASGFSTQRSLKEARNQVRNLGDVLREEAGVNARSTGGVGAFQSLSIRGSSSSQVTILLDGVALNHGGNGVVNLSDIPLDALKDVTIYRGFAPAHMGGAMGGVVSLRTRYPQGHQRFAANLSTASYGTLKTSLLYAQRWNRWSFLGLANYQGTDGSFPYYDDRGTPFETEDDLPETLRRNNFNHTVSSLLRAGYKIKRKLSLSLVHLLVYRNMGIPGIGNFRSQSANFQHLRNQIQLNLKGETLPWKQSVWNSQFYGSFQTDQFQDLEGEIGLGRQDNNNQSYQIGWNGRFAHTLFKRWQVGLSIRLRNENFAPQDNLTTNQPRPSRGRWQFVPTLNSTLSLFKRRLTLLTSGKLEWYSNLENSNSNNEKTPTSNLYPTGRVGLLASPTPWLQFKGNIGRYVRVPTFLELFGDRGTTVGNASLRPESGWKWDAGVALLFEDKGHLDWLKVESAFFWTQASDLIRFIQNSQRTMVAVNIDDARIIGVEGVVSLSLFGHFQVDTNLTWMEALNQSDNPSESGKQLPGRPVWEVSVRATLKSSFGNLYYRYMGLGGNFLDRANFRELAPRHNHSIGFKLFPGNIMRALDINTPWNGLTIVFEVRNLLDQRIGTRPLRPPLPNLKETTQAIADFSGYPLPGRTFTLTVNWNV